MNGMRPGRYAAWRSIGFFLRCALLLLTVGTVGCERQTEEGDLWVKIFEDPRRDTWQKPDEVVRRLGLRPGDTVVEIGAGTGYFTRRFALAVGPEGKAVGLDTEASMVDYMKRDARRRGLKQYEARLVNSGGLSLPPASADVIFINNTLSGIVSRIDYLKQLIPALKPNGRVVVMDFYDRPLPVGPHGGKLSESMVQEEFREAGYILIRSLDFLPYQYFLEFRPAQTTTRLAGHLRR